MNVTLFICAIWWLCISVIRTITGIEGAESAVIIGLLFLVLLDSSVTK